MIDWNKISEEDPETFWEILDWHEKLGTQWQFAEITELGMLRFAANTGAAYETMFLPDRTLYDYFDSAGLNVFCMAHNEIADLFCYQIENEDLQEFSEPDYWNDRVGAETAAFERAFTIREGQLK